MNENQQPKYHFFWRSGSPFSQFHSSHFDLDGVHFVCAEQAMMYGKAILFEDHETAKKILNASSPMKMKALGRQVRHFKDKTCKKHRYDIVYRNNHAKFTQNPHLLEALLATDGTLVEASPSDSIWGIGLHKDAAKRVPAKHWPGLNLLGQILTNLRDELRNSLEEVEGEEANIQREEE